MTLKDVTMKDVINVINILLQNLESDNSLANLIHVVRDLTSLIDFHDCLQACIKELSRAKTQDQKHFDNIASVVIKDVHHASLELKKKIYCIPRLKKGLNASFFDEIECKVKLSEYPIEEKPLLLIDPFFKLLNAILDLGETDRLIIPYASIATNNDNKFIREITFSDNIKTFCRDAEHFRGRRDLALWYAWDNIIIFKDWTKKNGIPNSAFREKLRVFSDKNQIRYALRTIYLHLLTSLSKVKTIEDNASASLSPINGNPPTIFLEQTPETFIITAIELFIHPFEGEIWLLLHYNNGMYAPYFVAWRKDGGKGFQFAMKVLHLHKGAVLDNEDLPARRNDLGIKGILKKIFFQNSKIFQGRYIRLDELNFPVSNEKLFAALPKSAHHHDRQFPVDAYNNYKKTTA